VEVDKTLVCNRNVMKGEIVFREKPLLVWSEIEIGSYFKAFLSSPKSIQDSILNMYHPPLDAMENSRVHEQRQVAFEISRMLSYDDVHTIHKVLMIRDTNAHAFFGEVQPSNAIVKPSKSKSPSSKSALFQFGSKVTHSCAPNCTYSSKWGGNSSVFVANVDLNPGIC
jgi:hypothetical protein